MLPGMSPHVFGFLKESDRIGFMPLGFQTTSNLGISFGTRVLLKALWLKWLFTDEET